MSLNIILLFFQYQENKCVLACTDSEDLAYHPSKENDFFYQSFKRINIEFQRYTQIAVEDEFKCSDNGVRNKFDI